MAINLPPHLAEQFQRIMGGRPNERGEILTEWPARTPQEAKASVARAELVKQELRSLRTGTRQEQAAALQPYDDLVDLIDRTLLELDRLTSELEAEAASMAGGAVASCRSRCGRIDPGDALQSAVRPYTRRDPGTSRCLLMSSAPPHRQPRCTHTSPFTQERCRKWLLSQSGGGRRTATSSRAI